MIRIISWSEHQVSSKYRNRHSHGPMSNRLDHRRQRVKQTLTCTRAERNRGSWQGIDPLACLEYRMALQGLCWPHAPPGPHFTIPPVPPKSKRALPLNVSTPPSWNSYLPYTRSNHPLHKHFPDEAMLSPRANTSFSGTFMSSIVCWGFTVLDAAW